MAAKHTRTAYEGFPGGSVVRNLPANARDGFDPQSGEDPTCCRATNSRVTTIEPVLWSRELHLLGTWGTTAEAHTAWSPRATREAQALPPGSGPRSLQLEKACTAVRTSAAKHKWIKWHKKEATRDTGKFSHTILSSSNDRNVPTHICRALKKKKKKAMLVRRINYAF